MENAIIYVAITGSGRNEKFSFFGDEDLLDEIKELQLYSDKSYEFIALGENWGETRFNLSDLGSSPGSFTADINIKLSSQDPYGIASGQSLVLTFLDPSRKIIPLTFFSNRPSSSYPGLTGAFQARSLKEYSLAIEVSNQEVKEGERLITKFQGPADLAGTKVYWKLEGITDGATVDGDVSTGQAYGDVTLDEDGSAEIFHYFYVGEKEYFYESQRDVFKFSLFSDAGHSSPIANSVTVMPVDAERAGYLVARFGKGTGSSNRIVWSDPREVLYLEDGDRLHFTLRPAQHGSADYYFELDDYMIPFQEVLVDGKMSAYKTIAPNAEEFRNAIGVWSPNQLAENIDVIAPNSGVGGWFTIRPDSYKLTGGNPFTLEYIEMTSGKVLVRQQVQIKEKNMAPTSIDIQSKSLDESVKAGSTISLLSTVDPNSADTHVYQLVNGDGSKDNDFFEVAANELRIKESPDFEAKSFYSIRLRSKDAGGLSVENSFVLTVHAPNEEELPVTYDNEVVKSINEKQFSDIRNSAQAISSSRTGFVIAGGFYPEDWSGGATSSATIQIESYGPEGDLLWNKAFGSGVAYALEITDDAVYSTGIANAETWLIKSGKSNQGDDAFLAKHDLETGRLQWATYVPKFPGFATGLSITSDSDNNVYIAGATNASQIGASTYYSPNTENMPYVAKFSGNTGELKWAKTYEILPGYRSAGFESVDVLSDGKIVISGKVDNGAQSYTDPLYTSYTYTALINAASGELVLPAETRKSQPYGSSVAVRSTKDGGYVHLSVSSVDRENTGILRKLSNAASVDWSINLPGIGAWTERDDRLEILDDGSIVVASSDNLSPNSSIYLVSSDGKLIGTKVIDEKPWSGLLMGIAALPDSRMVTHGSEGLDFINTEDLLIESLSNSGDALVLEGDEYNQTFDLAFEIRSLAPEKASSNVAVYVKPGAGADLVTYGIEREAGKSSDTAERIILLSNNIDIAQIRNESFPVDQRYGSTSDGVHAGGFAAVYGFFGQYTTDISFRISGKNKFTDVITDAVTGGTAADGTLDLYLTSGSNGDAFFLHDTFSEYHKDVETKKDVFGSNYAARVENINSIFAGDADDIVDLTTTESTGDISGGGVKNVFAGKGNDVVLGSTGNVFGEEGNDTLISHHSANMTGGSGKDIFGFLATPGMQDSVTGVISEPVHRIQDFETGVDSIKFYVSSDLEATGSMQTGNTDHITKTADGDIEWMYFHAEQIVKTMTVEMNGRSWSMDDIAFIAYTPITPELV